jgi:hypothetical protein
MNHPNRHPWLELSCIPFGIEAQAQRIAIVIANILTIALYRARLDRRADHRSAM